MWGLDYSLITFFAFIILFASLLQTSTGFGFSVMATPFLLLLFEPREAIQINLILSLFISIAFFLQVKKDVDPLILRRFIIGSIFGLPIGITMFLWMDMTRFKIGVSLLILLLTLLLVLRFRVKQTDKRDFVIGGFSGTLTASIGMPGPPILLYFSGTDTSKEKIRSTALTYYLFIYFVSFVIQVIFVGTTKTTWIYSAAALPIVIIGMMLGQVIFKWINQKVFQVVTYLILFFTGMYLMLTSIFDL